jgi:hypothetical protein
MVFQIIPKSAGIEKNGLVGIGKWGGVANNQEGPENGNTAGTDKPPPPRKSSRNLFRLGLLVWMAIFLILPGFTGLESVFSFEVRVALNGLPLLPRESKIDVLKLVIKSDLARI